MASIRENQEEEFNLKPGTKFVICSVHFKEHCFTRAFHPSQRRQVMHGALPSVWKKDELRKTCESERNHA